MIRYSIGGITEDEIYTEDFRCPGCGKTCTFRLKNHGIKVRIFGIPLISAIFSHELVCDYCGHAVKVKRKEYRKKVAEQLLRFKHGMYNPEYVVSECHPKKLGIPGRIFRLVICAWVTGALTTSFLDVIFGIKSVVEALVAIPVVGAFVGFLYIALAMCVNGLHISLRKYGLYRINKRKIKNGHM